MTEEHDSRMTLDRSTVEAVARVLAATPLQGCMDDEGLAVYLRHIWPREAGQANLDATLLSLAQAALKASEMLPKP